MMGIKAKTRMRKKKKKMTMKIAMKMTGRTAEPKRMLRRLRLQKQFVE
jgi:hypothetical protein